MLVFCLFLALFAIFFVIALVLVLPLYLLELGLRFLVNPKKLIYK